MGIDLPVLDSGELEADKRLVGVLSDLELNILDVEVSLLVVDPGPVELPLEQVEEKTEAVVVLFGKVQVHVDEVGQEHLHSLFEGVDGLLLETDLKSWVHSLVVPADEPKYK